jgi:hypothetical protein
MLKLPAAPPTPTLPVPALPASALGSAGTAIGTSSSKIGRPLSLGLDGGTKMGGRGMLGLGLLGLGLPGLLPLSPSRNTSNVA